MSESRPEIQFQSLLKEKFLELRTRNPSFSLRAFSQRLGISSGALSDVMNGKRVLSRKIMSRLLDRMGLDPERKIEILHHYDRDQLRRELGQESAPPLEHLRISADQFSSISDWRHYAILSLLHTRDFRPDPAWIAERLGQSLHAIEPCLERLLRLGLIRFDEGKKTYLRSAPRFETTDDVINLSVRQAHQENLELARESLDKISVEDRDFSIYNIAINPEQLPKAKQLIRRFQEELGAVLGEGPLTEVYRFSTQLFPLTRLKDKE